MCFVIVPKDASMVDDVFKLHRRARAVVELKLRFAAEHRHEALLVVTRLDSFC